MSSSIHTRSTFLSLIFTGRFRSVLNPWHIILNFEELTLTIRKRNWYLIGFDETVAPFRFIRKIAIDTHLFGADMKITIYGSGTLQVNSIPKSMAKKIKESLLDYNNKKKGGGERVIF